MMIRKNRGLKLGGKLVKVFKWWVNGRTRFRSTKAMSKICNWVRSLKHKAKGLSFMRKNSGYIRVGSELMMEEKTGSGHPPKGHLAVYVGDKEDDTSRVLVPVIYFNHPLFVDLLREAEMVYGFNHDKGIQIPCHKTKFENVKMKIAATSGGGSCRRRGSCIKL